MTGLAGIVDGFFAIFAMDRIQSDHRRRGYLSKTTSDHLVG